MTSQYEKLKRDAGGQAMIETALVLPFLLGLAFNAVNFAYFFIIAINLAAAPRSGVEYSIVGSATPSSATLPQPGLITDPLSVSYLTLNDITGAINISGISVPQVQVCTPAYLIGGSGTMGSGVNQKSNCWQSPGAPVYPRDADPEAPAFVLNRVDVTYAFHPLIDQRVFNLILPASVCTGSGGGVTCTFHRQTSMRAMN